MALAAIVAAAMVGSLGSGAIAQDASDTVAQAGLFEISKAYEAAAPSVRQARSQLAQYDTKLDKGGMDRKIDKGGADMRLDKGGVDKMMDKSQMDRKMGTDAVDKKLDNSNLDTPPTPKMIPAPATK